MRSIDNLEAISDGKVYTINDTVYADAGGCANCSACCQGVGDLVALNPFDVYEIVTHTHMTFDDLLIDRFELYQHGKIALPHLKMQGISERCSFLNEEDRCTIHMHRPDICRLFPLGRFYEDDDFNYFLQVDACVKSDLAEIQVEQWIATQNYTENKAFILAWYRLLKALTFRLKFIRDEKELTLINTFLLNTFYRLSLKEGEDFYTAFFDRLPAAKNELGII